MLKRKDRTNKKVKMQKEKGEGKKLLKREQTDSDKL
jgi:hypothetical protein